MPRAVAGRVHDVDLEARELEPLPAADRMIRLVALVRPESRPRDEAHDVREHRDLDLRAPDRRLGGAGERRHRADVVEVAMRDEDRFDLEPEVVDRIEDAIGVVAGIDHDRPLGAVGPGDVAVLADRADRKGADVHQRLALCAARAFCAWRRV